MLRLPSLFVIELIDYGPGGTTQYFFARRSGGRRGGGGVAELSCCNPVKYHSGYHINTCPFVFSALLHTKLLTFLSALSSANFQKTGTLLKSPLVYSWTPLIRSPKERKMV